MLSEGTAVLSIGCARVQQLGCLFSILCFSYTEFWTQGTLLILVSNWEVSWSLGLRLRGGAAQWVVRVLNTCRERPLILSCPAPTRCAASCPRADPVSSTLGTARALGTLKKNTSLEKECKYCQVWAIDNHDYRSVSTIASVPGISHIQPSCEVGAAVLVTQKTKFSEAGERPHHGEGNA